MGKSSYDIEWRVEGFHWWSVARRKLLESILLSFDSPFKGFAVDIGCGVGSNLNLLRSLGISPIGLDNSIYALSLAKSNLKLPLINGDLNILQLDPNQLA